MCSVGRDCQVAEELYELSVKNNVTIVPADMPQLYTHTPNSLDKYLRKIVFATTELERDHAVSRLQDGLSRKMATTTRRGQNGKLKVNGALTMLAR
jgi:predicted GTPase